jgi:hypothetical protein
MTLTTRQIAIFLCLAMLAACTRVFAREDCPITQPVWAVHPADSAVPGEPSYGYYYVNEDSSIWASAWWSEEDGSLFRVTEEGTKIGWFRPAGATLDITGQRLDGDSPPLEAHASCCYPTRFQASGLYFPTAGCWEITGRAKDSELTFVIWVEPDSASLKTTP